MKAKKLIKQLKKETKNIDFIIDFEDENSIIINYLQKDFLIYGYVEFDKTALHYYREGYIKYMATDIANKVGKKAFRR